MNCVTITGRMTGDPELKATNAGDHFCRFTVAVADYKKGSADSACFFDTVTWGKTAEFVAHYLKRGTYVEVVGKLREEKWRARDGTKRRDVIIVASNVQTPLKAFNNPPAEVVNSTDNAGDTQVESTGTGDGQQVEDFETPF